MGSAAGRHECSARFASTAAKGSRLVCIRNLRWWRISGGAPAGCHMHWLRPSQVARPQDYIKSCKNARRKALLHTCLPALLFCLGSPRFCVTPVQAAPGADGALGGARAGRARTRAAVGRDAALLPAVQRLRRPPVRCCQGRSPHAGHSLQRLPPALRGRRAALADPSARSENPASNTKVGTHLIGARPTLYGRRAPLVACQDGSYNPMLHACHTHLRCICPPCVAGPAAVR